MNFCKNISAYHRKRRADQFYDFTIKDKNGVEVKSHKFILASQSEYFAGLFRIHLNASETTFTNFSLDAIKPCIDFLYNHKVNLESCNVQDVLLFADYINLTDVRDICINYIIKVIDHSNYAFVSELGNTLGIDELVEAGVLFLAKTLSVRTIESLDHLTKEMIIKVACWQQQRVTVMTTEQWSINLLKQWLEAPNELLLRGFETRGSSVYLNNLDNWASKFAIDGKVSGGNIFYFHSQLEMHPWLEVKLPSPILISSLTIINRKNGFYSRLRNVEVRAGMMPVPEGLTENENGNHNNKQIEVNSRCGLFAGPPSRFISKGHTIKFEKPTLAQYITLQILDKGILQINGLKINGGDLLNHEHSF